MLLKLLAKLTRTVLLLACVSAPGPLVLGQCLSVGYFIKLQNISSWKGLRGITESSSWTHVSPISGPSAVPVQDGDELAQGLQFSCAELPAIRPYTLRSLPPLGKQWLYTTCYISQNVWSIHMSLLQQQIARSSPPHPALPSCVGTSASCCAGEVAKHREHHSLQCNSSRQGSTTHQAFSNVFVARFCTQTARRCIVQLR